MTEQQEAERYLDLALQCLVTENEHMPAEEGDYMTGSSVSGGRSEAEYGRVPTRMVLYLLVPEEGSGPVIKSLAKAVRSVAPGHVSPPGDSGSLPRVLFRSKGSTYLLPFWLEQVRRMLCLFAPWSHSANLI